MKVKALEKCYHDQLYEEGAEFNYVPQKGDDGKPKALPKWLEPVSQAANQTGKKD